MKKGIAILFLALYVFNLAGYYVVFKTLQYRVRSEIKTRIKESVPQAELVLIAVGRGEEHALHWLDEREFRLHGNMYDIVYQYSRNDTTYYSCVNDKQEELLFANLDMHVAVQSNLEGIPKKASAPFKGAVKEYFPLVSALPSLPPEQACTPIIQMLPAASFLADVPTPPPRFA